MISKDRLVFDTANASEGDVVAAFLKADDGTLITHTGGALNVNVANSIAVTGTVTVTATDLDIRDLAFATDKVDVSGSEVSLDAATISALQSVTVSATDLDIRDLAFATDKVDVSGSVITATVSATDLDIRSLVAASDSVTSYLADGAGNPLNSSAGALDVNITNAISVTLDGFYDAGDNATPDTVGQILHQRAASPGLSDQTFRATGASPSSDNVNPANVHAADTNAFAMAWDGSAWDRLQAVSGALKVDIASQSLAAVTVSDAANANSALTSTAKAVSDTSGALLASQAAGRKYLIAQNLGNRSIYVGASGVTTSTGLRLSPGSSLEARIGAAVSLHAVTDSGTQDTRILEIA